MISSDQHVVVHTDTRPESGEYRFEILRYPSLASAQAMYVDQSVVYTSAKDFEDRMTMSLMKVLGKYILRNHFEERAVPKSKPLRARWLWETALRYARPHNPRANTRGPRAEKRADTRYRVSPLYKDFAVAPMPPQVKAMFDYFLDHMSPDGVDEEGVEMLIQSMHEEGLLVTRQDPVRIWRYYRKDMLDRCLLELV